MAKNLVNCLHIIFKPYLSYQRTKICRCRLSARGCDFSNVELLLSNFHIISSKTLRLIKFIELKSKPRCQSLRVVDKLKKISQIKVFHARIEAFKAKVFSIQYVKYPIASKIDFRIPKIVAKFDEKSLAEVGLCFLLKISMEKIGQ